jgi:hypothetical protein
VALTGVGGGYVVAAAPSGPAATEPGKPEGKPDGKPEAKSKHARADRSPGLLDSLGTTLKRVTAPIRSLWN